MREPAWVAKKVVLQLHLRQLAEHGGATGVRDGGLLESALAKPRNILAYDPSSDLARLAASYAYGIARNHPFVDGNKRTALVVAETFLELNGFITEAAKEDKYITFMRLADGTLSEVELTAWLTGHIAAL